MAPQLKPLAAQQREDETTNADTSSVARLRRVVKKKKTQRSGNESPLKQYIPHYLSEFVMPYYGDFCYTPIFHVRLVAQLMAEGFLPIATHNLLLPKLHELRCVVTLPDHLHVSKSVRKKSKRFTFSFNRAFRDVVAGCHEQHGTQCWLHPPLVETFYAIHSQPNGIETTVAATTPLPQPSMEATTGATTKTSLTTHSQDQTAEQSPGTNVKCRVRLYSIEVWNEETGTLAGGELGYTVGSIYTSLTGFSREDSAGSSQLAALGRCLCRSRFTLWDLGMDMDYKQSLGSHLMPRDEFVRTVHQARQRPEQFLLPEHVQGVNCRTIIEQYDQPWMGAQTTQSSQQSASITSKNSCT